MELEHETDVAVAETGQLFVLQCEHVLAFVAHFALLRGVKRADNLKQRCLARTAGTHDRHDFALCDVKIHTPEHFQVAISLNYVTSLNHRSMHLVLECKGNKKWCKSNEMPNLFEHFLDADQFVQKFSVFG